MFGPIGILAVSSTVGHFANQTNGIPSSGHELQFLDHEIELCEAGLHPDRLANLRSELAEAREIVTKPKQVSPSCLVPMSMDDYFQGRTIKTQNCEERPDS